MAQGCGIKACNLLGKAIALCNCSSKNTFPRVHGGLGPCGSCIPSILLGAVWTCSLPGKRRCCAFLSPVFMNSRLSGLLCRCLALTQTSALLRRGLSIHTNTNKPTQRFGKVLCPQRASVKLWAPLAPLASVKGTVPSQGALQQVLLSLRQESPAVLG